MTTLQKLCKICNESVIKIFLDNNSRFFSEYDDSDERVLCSTSFIC